MQSNMKIKKFYFNNKQNIEQKGTKNQKKTAQTRLKE